ncbi:PLP-dependent aminotransferase family protein [Mixta theicola]|nr:PLP-dependent aminotransferase family protein [Mixta theicola]GLR08983.1 GntR family transcriptional regulator [Mixta theicola]
MGYKGIYEQYRQLIVTGLLKPGDKLPAIRVLAEELKVARKTVEAAYAILTGEGYIVSQGAKGTLVNPDLKIKPVTPPVEAKAADAGLSMITSLRDGNGDLRLGIPALDEFPFKKWLLLSGKAARSLRPEEMTSQPLMGYAPLRQALAGYLQISRGINCTPEQIFVTNGYRTNIRLILQALAQHTDKVVMEDPGYFFGQKLLKRIAPNLHYSPVNQQGLDTDYFKKHHPDARFVIVTPTHQSPLAVSLSLPRKHELLEWARENQGWIVEDDYDGEFHYTRKVIPALKSLDTNERVIYVGTFSKTIMPALRIGYIVMPPETIQQFNEIGEIMETGQPLLPQKILSMFLSEGHFFKHIKRMRSLYQQRREIMLNALNALYSEIFYYELTEGGMHIVAFLRKGTQDVQIATIWQAHNLQVFPLSSWYSQTQKRYGLILGYTNIRSEAHAMTLLKKPLQETLVLFK